MYQTVIAVEIINIIDVQIVLNADLSVQIS